MQRAKDSGIVAIAGIALSAGGNAEKRGTVATTWRRRPALARTVSRFVALLLAFQRYSRLHDGNNARRAERGFDQSYPRSRGTTCQRRGFYKVNRGGSSCVLASP
jgi:hypothetical protein